MEEAGVPLSPDALDQADSFQQAGKTLMWWLWIRLRLA
jgi:hypothetical protein